MDREIAEHISPFGEADCESELKLLRGEYSKYFFYHTWFNEAALDPNVFLIVGRRGTGKTALSQFFTFQKRFQRTTAIDVDEPVAFEQVLQDIASTSTQSREVAIPRIAKVWSFVIWSIIFRELKDRDTRIRAACIFGDRSGKLSSFIRHALKSLLNRLLQTENDLWNELEDILADDRIQAGQKAVLELARKNPVILSIDTLENYAINDVAMMRAIAALVQFGSDFNRDYGLQGLHLKLFLMGEVFPYLKEEMVLNPLKFIRNVVYLHWRPKDLMRLISWRFYTYLQAIDQLDPASKVIDWDSHEEVLEKLWYPYFGTSLRNRQDLPERTFPYLLRYTQMRPRQLIVLSNAIASRALAEKTFPHFRSKDIVHAIYQRQNDLAEEVFNSYSSIYPKVGRIVEALSGLPMLFKGNELDKRAPLTASEWPSGEYSPLAFRQLVAELGIIGRVRHLDEKAGYVEADFEYSLEGRLPLMVTDLCVIHPMFYRKLNITLDRRLRVYPFPDHDEYKDLDYYLPHAGR
jgi:Cdc6-like AAA superfamily ATPase